MSAARLCKQDGKPLVGKRRDAEFCNDKCRKRYVRRENRERDKWRKLLTWCGETTRAARERGELCRCNGSHIEAHDSTGDPACDNCGNPRPVDSIEEVVRLGARLIVQQEKAGGR